MKPKRSGALIASRSCIYFSLGLALRVNDDASPGRRTNHVPDVPDPEDILEAEVPETQPMVVQTLVDEQFRAVDVSAGDSVSVALWNEGDLRAWGSFRVSLVSFVLTCDRDPVLRRSPGFRQETRLFKNPGLPLSIPALKPYQFVPVACGTYHVVALTTSGHVYTWGIGIWTDRKSVV